MKSRCYQTLPLVTT